jgi:hypothetical protein
MEGDLLAEAVDFVEVVVGDGLGYDWAGDGSEGAIRDFDDVGNVVGNGVDASKSKGLVGKEDGIEEFDIASKDCGGHD